MNIEDFVADSLTQICKGIVKAQENTEKLGACVSPRMHSGVANCYSGNPHDHVNNVAFDLVVETSQDIKNEKGSTKATVSVYSFFSISNGDKSNIGEELNRNLSRIKFDIPVCWPIQVFKDKFYVEPPKADAN